MILQFKTCCVSLFVGRCYFSAILHFLLLVLTVTFFSSVKTFTAIILFFKKNLFQTFYPLSKKPHDHLSAGINLLSLACCFVYCLSYYYVLYYAKSLRYGF